MSQARPDHRLDAAVAPREEKAGIVRRFREEVLPAFDAGRLNVSIDAVYRAGRGRGRPSPGCAENLNTGKILHRLDPRKRHLDSA